ncbi:MAG: GGDEF domain-containing protein [Clostridia bacterium]|nr:GGDEF domain-containing protein [Clostridia bacterium]
MGNWIALLNDVCVIIFDLLLYVQMTTLRRNKTKNKRILYAGCAVIVVFYILAVFVLSWPVSISAFVCMTIPSLALFWALCKYRDARFFLTFCFVDTVSLIVGFIARYIGILLGDAGGVLALVLTLLLFTIIYRTGKPYFKKYRESLEFIDEGWKKITCSAVIIYITLIFCAAYPKPLIERQEYLLPYLVMCIMVLSFYVVTLASIAMIRKTHEQSIQLKKQQKWFVMAYVDALTGIPNRMAYMEKIHELERMKDTAASVAIVVMDLDNFKDINDALGHSMGDEVLRRAAKCLSDSFSGDSSTVYRIGGDEFAAVAVGVGEDELSKKLEALGEFRDSDIKYSISCGYSFVDRSEDNAVDRAFSRADAIMYANKAQKTSSGYAE